MSGRIEFVADAAAFEPEPPRPPRSRRQWVVRGVALAVVVAALATWIATRPATGHSRAQHRRQALQPVPSILDTEPIQGRTQCRGGGPVDVGVAAAMHRFLHRVTLQPTLGQRCVLTVGTKRRIVAEAVTASAHGYDVQVNLSARSAQFPPPVPRDRAIELGRIETEAAGVRVQVIATGFPAAGNPPMVRLQRLADFLSLNTAL
jgi:hypothetical protein